MQIPNGYSRLQLSPRLIDGFHDMGLEVHVWTINDEEEMRFLIETYGIDGIMTDDPPLLTKVINELGVGD